MPQGSLERSPAAAVSEPFSFSNPQKKSVLFGWPSLFTPMLPAKLRGSDQVTPGSESVTSKSVHERGLRQAVSIGVAKRLTALPIRAKIAGRLAGVVLRPAAGSRGQLGENERRDSQEGREEGPAHVGMLGGEESEEEGCGVCGSLGWVYIQGRPWPDLKCGKVICTRRRADSKV